MNRRLSIKRSDAWSKSQDVIKLTKGTKLKAACAFNKDFCQQSRVQRHSLLFFLLKCHTRNSLSAETKSFASKKKFFFQSVFAIIMSWTNNLCNWFSTGGQKHFWNVLLRFCSGRKGQMWFIVTLQIVVWGSPSIPMPRRVVAIQFLSCDVAEQNISVFRHCSIHKNLNKQISKRRFNPSHQQN